MADASSPEISDGLPPASRDVVEDWLEAELRGADQLRDDVRAHLDRIEKEKHDYEFLHSELARAIADRYLQLLESFDDYSADQQRLIQAGLMYWVDPEDADDDFASVIGFDGDRDVLNRILEHLDCPEVILET